MTEINPAYRERWRNIYGAVRGGIRLNRYSWFQRRSIWLHYDTTFGRKAERAAIKACIATGRIKERINA
jgi:hypothetical protein